MSKRERERGQVEKTDQYVTTVRTSYSLVDGISSQKRGATIIRVVVVVVMVRRVSFQPLELTTPPYERQKRMEQKQKKQKKKKEKTETSISFVQKPTEFPVTTKLQPQHKYNISLRIRIILC